MLTGSVPVDFSAERGCKSGTTAAHHAQQPSPAMTHDTVVMGEQMNALTCSPGCTNTVYDISGRFT